MITRYLGTCPVCFREQKLHKMLMVHHGYQRPGHGYIQGDCYGVGWAPFELSPDGTIAFVERVLQPSLEHNVEFLRRLQAGEVTELLVEVRLGFGERRMKTLTAADGYEFKSQIRSHTVNTENQIRHLTQDIRECTQKVAQWREQPVRTEEEVEQVRARMTDQRRAVIEEARAAKRAKREALDAKQRARDQERADLLDEYRNIFEQLAHTPTSEARAEAKRHWIQMHKRKSKKGYLDFYPNELDVAEALVRLGLAKPVSYGTGYLYSNEYAWEPR